MKGFFNYYTYDWTFENLTMKYTGEERVNKCKQVQLKMYNVFLHTFYLVLGVCLFHDEEWMPTYLGGKSDCSNIFINYPNWPEKVSFVSLTHPL